MAEAALAIAEMRSWVNTIFDAMERAGLASVPVDRQYYWQVSSSDTFEPGNQPQIVVGDVLDDIADLRREVANFRANEGMFLPHALDHLSGVVTFLAATSDGTVVFLDDKDEAS